MDVWRSETLLALTTLPENETRLEGALRRICEDLANSLSPWLLEAGPFHKVEGKFRREILGPAIRLHQDFKSSSHPYEMKTIKAPNEYSPRQMLDEWRLKDADLWQERRKEREIGRALHCLHPSLVRNRPQGMAAITIVKPVIVVSSPDRTMSYSSKNSSRVSVDALSTVAEAGSTTDQKAPAYGQGSLTQATLADNTRTPSDSVSDRDSDEVLDGLEERQVLMQSPGPQRQQSPEIPQIKFQHASPSPEYIRHISRGPYGEYREEWLGSRRLREDEGSPAFVRNYRLDGRKAGTFPFREPSRESSQIRYRHDLEGPYRRKSTTDSHSSPSASSPPKLGGWKNLFTSK